MTFRVAPSEHPASIRVVAALHIYENDWRAACVIAERSKDTRKARCREGVQVIEGLSYTIIMGHYRRAGLHSMSSEVALRIGAM